MEALSQFDLAHPDHVSVHIRSGNILVSVKKDGGTWNLEMPLASNDRKVFDTAPAQTRIPATTKPTVLQQTTTVVAEKEQPLAKKPSIVRIDRTQDGKQIEKRATYKVQYNGAQPFTSKLTEKQVREIRSILADKQLMATYKSDYKAYKDLAEAYGVSYMTIQFIHKNVTWKHVKV